MSEIDKTDFIKDPLYIKISVADAVHLRGEQDFNVDSFNTQLAKEAQLLNVSGEAFSRQFADGISHNDFAQSQERTLLLEAIDAVKATEPGDKKTWLQAFLALNIPLVIDSHLLPQQMRTNWELLTNKLIEENGQKLKDEYSNSVLAKFKPADFPSPILRSMAEREPEIFDRFKQVTWLLTSAL